MITETTIDEMTEYASDALAEKAKPSDENYAMGVKAGWTAPAPWWNWLFNALTKIAVETRNDVTSLLTELNNALLAAGVQPDSANEQQLADAIEVLSRPIATADNRGTVKSSSEAGSVSVNPNTGIMSINGLGDLNNLIAPAQNLVDAIEFLYEGLLSLEIGVPVQPAQYDTSNPVLNTAALSDPLALGEINLAAGWYYIQIAGAGGGGNGGKGVLSQSWVFFPTPSTFIYCAGKGGTASAGGTNNFKTISARLPSYAEGTDATHTGGASLLICCATQEVYIASGGAGNGGFAVKNTVMATNTEYVSGCMAPGQSEMSSGQRPFGVSGWSNSNGGGAGGSTGANGYIKIYRGL